MPENLLIVRTGRHTRSVFRGETEMHKHSGRVVSVIAAAIVTALAGVDEASAAGAVNISACGTLGTYGATYRLTTDLTSCGVCVVVANNQITIGLQGHSITAGTACSGIGAAITDLATGCDVAVRSNSRTRTTTRPGSKW